MEAQRPLVSFEEGWAEIDRRAIATLTEMLEQGITVKTKPFPNKDWVEIYTVAYNMCTQNGPYVSSPAAQLYQAHEETIQTYLQKFAVPALRDKREVVLLLEFVKRWERFKIMNKWLGHFLRYLDRFHVMQNNLLPLQESGLAVFKRTVFEVVHANVCEAAIALIGAERQGEVVDVSLLAKVVDVFRVMNSYSGQFEEPLLKDSKGFFSKRAQEWLAVDSTPQYLLKVELLIESEKARVKSYLLPSTEPLIVTLAANELLKEQETALLEKEGSGARALLRNDQKDDLARVYRMFSKVADGLPPVAKIVQEHIEAAGKVVLRNREAKISAPDYKDTGEASEFIKELLELHEKYRSLVVEQFASDSLFQKALKMAIEMTVNENIGKHKTAELLSTYADSKLRSGGEDKLSDSQVEDVLENIVQLFAFLEDKDVFAEVYRNQLAKRLLNQRSLSHDAERAMIAKLKLRCGAQFTSKHEGMLTDLALGQDLQKRFQDHELSLPDDKRLPIEFSCEVLTTGHWPTYQSLKPTLPKTMARCIDTFTSFYTSINNMRQLTWVHALGSVTVKATFKTSYDLQLTTLQAVCLVSFNGTKDEYVPFGDVQAKTGIEPAILKKVLHSLSCQKVHVLEKDPPSQTIDPAKDRFRVYADFASKTRKLKIPMASLEENHNPERIEEDRSYAIEACIVRIMKARKMLNHQNLVNEVMAQLQAFKPNVKVVKKRIEHLIEREYLARDETDPGQYKYLA